MVTNLSRFLHKRVIIVSTNQKVWRGYVDEYDPDDSFLDYEGESIDVIMEDSKDIVCFGTTDIVSIEIIPD